MNYVAHLLLAQPHGVSWIASLMGDFMTGTPLEGLPPDLRKGVENHYAIDRYTDQHPGVRELKGSFLEPFRHIAGISLDIAFDHFLIRNWNSYCTLSLQEFLDRVYRGLLDHESLWNEKMKLPLQRMIERNWLPVYGSMEGLEKALFYLGKRFSFDNPVAASFSEIERLYKDIQTCFLSFFSQLIHSVESWEIEVRSPVSYLKIHQDDNGSPSAL